MQTIFDDELNDKIDSTSLTLLRLPIAIHNVDGSLHKYRVSIFSVLEKNNINNLILTLCTANFISISLAAPANAFKCFIWNLLEPKNKTI